jgi:AhpC/TSA family
LLLAVVPALGALNNNLQPDKTPREQYAAIAAEYQKAQVAFSKLYSQAKTEEERKELLSKLPNSKLFAERMLQVAEKYPKDDAAIDALQWVGMYAPQEVGLVAELITKNHLADPRVVKVMSVVLVRLPAGEKLLRTLAEKNTAKDVQGLAYFYLAQGLKNQSDVAQRQKKPEAAAELLKQAEELFDRVEKDYGNIKVPSDAKDNSRTLRDLVEPELFELRFLTVGKTAPDIEAPDLDGKAFKLSDYRGKVILLDFWGHW